MRRRKAREYAFQLLFQYNFTGKRPEKVDFQEFREQKKENAELTGFVEDLVYGTLDNLHEIDASIQKAAEHWVLERMASVDRNILRLATYELLYRRDIPSAATINEAIEIAKKYSTTESASFINGILDRIAKGIKNKKTR